MNDVERKPLAEQLRESIHSMPDKNTLAWWDRRWNDVEKAYRGLTHSLNLAIADMRDKFANVTKLITRMDGLAAENHDLRADVGELQARIVAMEARFEDMAKWAASKGKRIQSEEPGQ